MRTTTEAGGSTPARPATSSCEAQVEAAECADRHRQPSPPLAKAATSLALACLLTGGAFGIALGNPASLGLPPMAGMAGVVGVGVAALAAGGIGTWRASRERPRRPGQLQRTSRAEQIQHDLDVLGLTPREMAIARLILQHRSYKEIAECCELSQRTVQFHASNIFRKAYVSRRRDFERIMLAETPPRGEAPATYERIARIRPQEPPWEAPASPVPAPLVPAREAPARRAPHPAPSAEQLRPRPAPLAGSPRPDQVDRRQQPATICVAQESHDQWLSVRLAGSPTMARSRFAQHRKR